MENLIKCPVCGKVIMLEVKNGQEFTPKMAEKFLTCPNCKEKRQIKEYKMLTPQAPKQADDKTDLNAFGKKQSDETEVSLKKASSPGYLQDKKTGLRYDLQAGQFTVGRKPQKSAPLASLPIVTDDQGMSRVHMNVKVTLARDGRYHVYVSNAENKNPTYINGDLLKGEDMVGLKSGDVLTLCKTELKYVGTEVDDKTELNLKKK